MDCAQQHQYFLNDIMKINKSRAESGLIITSVSKTVEIEAKKQDGRIFGMLFGAVGASLLGNMSAGKGVV